MCVCVFGADHPVDMCADSVFALVMCVDSVFALVMCVDSVFALVMCLDSVFALVMCLDSVFALVMCVDSLSLLCLFHTLPSFENCISSDLIYNDIKPVDDSYFPSFISPVQHT